MATSQEATQTAPPRETGEEATRPDSTVRGEPTPAEEPRHPDSARRGTDPGSTAVPTGPLGLSTPAAAADAAAVQEASGWTAHLVDMGHPVDMGPILQPLPPAPPSDLAPEWLRRRQNRASGTAPEAHVRETLQQRQPDRAAAPALQPDRAAPPALQLTELEVLVAILPLFAGILLLLAGVGAGTVVIPG